MHKEYQERPLAWIDFGWSVAVHALLLLLVAFLIIRAPEVGVEVANIAAEFQLFEARESPSITATECEEVQPVAREPEVTAEARPPQEAISETPAPVEHLPVESHIVPIAEIPPKPQPAASAAPKAIDASWSARPPSRASSPLKGAKEALPDYLRNPPPTYPETSRLAKEEGVVMVLVEVGAMGTPTDVRLQRSSGYASLDEAAIRAVREWRFRPGTMGGVAVASSVSIPVRFELH
jgi:protein TonB